MYPRHNNGAAIWAHQPANFDEVSSFVVVLLDCPCAITPDTGFNCRRLLSTTGFWYGSAPDVLHGLLSKV